MTPAFDSVSAFFAMGGYAPYVWTCYGAFFGCLGLLTLMSVRRRRVVEADLRRFCRLAENGDRAAMPVSDSAPEVRPFGQVDQSRP